MGAESDALLRLAIFVSVFAVLAAAEALWPRRAIAERGRRWTANLALVALNTLVLRLTFLVVPALSVLAALYVEGKGWGALPALGVTGAAAVAIAFVALDLAIYAQHVAFHFITPLWRLHRVHHGDTDFDVTTGVRFHPGEILVSQVWKIVVVTALGAPVFAVVAFEIVLSAASMFSHTNLRLPQTADAVLRLVTVTPEMHRVHHSIVMAETNSNFGFNFSLWDRLFGTYRAKAQGDQATMPIGLASYRGAEPARLAWLLRFPFMRGPSA